jgi:hypothetical protein
MAAMDAIMAIVSYLLPLLSLAVAAIPLALVLALIGRPLGAGYIISAPARHQFF